MNAPLSHILGFERDRILREARGLSHAHKAILFILNSHLGTKDTCWPSQSLLAEEAGMSERTLIRRLAELEEKGWIHRRRNVPFRGAHVTHYQILWSALYTPQRPTKAEVSKWQVAKRQNGTSSEIGVESSRCQSVTSSKTEGPSSRCQNGISSRSAILSSTKCQSDTQRRQEKKTDLKEPPIVPQGGSPSDPELADPEPDSSPAQAQLTLTDEPVPDAEAVLWDRLEDLRIEALTDQGRPHRRRRLTKAIRRQLSARMGERHRPDHFEAVWRWWLYSTDERAVFLRERRFGPETLLRPSKFAGYLDRALECDISDPHLSEADRAPFDAEGAWAHLVESLGCPKAGQPPSDAAGWHFYRYDRRVHDAFYDALCAAMEERDRCWAWEHFRHSDSRYDHPRIRRAFTAAWPGAWRKRRAETAIDCKRGLPLGELARLESIERQEVAA